MSKNDQKSAAECTHPVDGAIGGESAGVELDNGRHCKDCAALKHVRIGPTSRIGACMSHRATCRKCQEVSPSQEHSKFYRNSSTYVAAGCLVADKRAVMNLDFGA